MHVCLPSLLHQAVTDLGENMGATATVNFPHARALLYNTANVTDCATLHNVLQL